VSDIPQDLLYTEDHEYLKPAGEADVMYIGVTDFAQGELGDIVFIELPKVGATFKKHDVFGTIEAVKAVSELYAPVSGEVVEINARLDAEPALVNKQPLWRWLDGEDAAYGCVGEGGTARRERLRRQSGLTRVEGRRRPEQSEGPACHRAKKQVLHCVQDDLA